MRISRVYAMLVACMAVGSAVLTSCSDAADSGSDLTTAAVGEPTAAVT